MTTYDEGSQSEKRAIIQAEAKLRAGDRPATTYHEIGNHPAHDQAKPDASALKYPALPASSPWSGNAWGEEPPIDATDCGDTVGVALGGKGG